MADLLGSVPATHALLAAAAATATANGDAAGAASASPSSATAEGGQSSPSSPSARSAPPGGTGTKPPPPPGPASKPVSPAMMEQIAALTDTEKCLWVLATVPDAEDRVQVGVRCWAHVHCLGNCYTA